VRGFLQSIAAVDPAVHPLLSSMAAAVDGSLELYLSAAAMITYMT